MMHRLILMIRNNITR